MLPQLCPTKLKHTLLNTEYKAAFVRCEVKPDEFYNGFLGSGYIIIIKTNQHTGIHLQ